MDAIQALEHIQHQLADTTKAYRIGAMAVEMIRGHIYQGNFTPLSPLTKAVRGGNAKPLQDKASLRDSFTFEVVKGDNGNVKIILGTSHIAAPIQNYGGTIKAKRAKNLTIPASDFTRTFERRYGPSPREVIAGLKNDGWLVFRPLDPRMKRPMNIILAQKKVIQRSHRYDDRRKPIRLYVLRKSVTIPAREYWYLSDEELAILMEELI